jgi:uncharacterized protein YdbL (DUF1318 family)
MPTLKDIHRFHAALARHIRQHPELTYQQVSKEFGISVQQVSKIAREHGIKRREAGVRFRLTPELLKKLGEAK